MDLHLVTLVQQFLATSCLVGPLLHVLYRLSCGFEPLLPFLDEGKEAGGDLGRRLCLGSGDAFLGEEGLVGQVEVDDGAVLQEGAEPLRTEYN
ncbi:hypothetical protein ES703_98357 [subsurface metagenome]